ncbi:MAG: hypothetical protein K9J12_16640 [Melioribacteraceae bacterium]|nr:hypothetical protein [Melioribacteraceae bacterium]
MDHKLEIMINEYFDGELQKEKEPFLFTQLSQNNEAREYFKKLHSVESAVKDNLEEFPTELENSIFSAISEKSTIEPKVDFWARYGNAAFAYAFSILMLAASVFLYTNSVKYEERLQQTTIRVEQQNEMINLLINGLPETKIEDKFDDQIIIQSNL